jgi:hypothetical protein
MIGYSRLTRQTFDAPCSVEIEHSPQSLHAHVEIEGEFEMQPGDQVLVHDAPSDAPYGERIVVRRRATVIRAGLLERAWTRLAGNFELTELYDVSFSERRRL